MVNAMLDRIEKLPVPVVAAIHGFCVGGGLELILACHYRIATRDPSTKIGFPEVKLGIFPGFNGTARSIRQAGPMAAMSIMLTGSMISASAAKGMGLIDELVAGPDSLPLGGAQGCPAETQIQARRLCQGGAGANGQPVWLLAKKMRSEVAEESARGSLPRALPAHRPLRKARRRSGCHEGAETGSLRADAHVADSRATCAACSSFPSC